MSTAVIVWQLFIFLTLLFSGRNRGWVAAGWVAWTLIQVYGLPLSVLQFFTIFLGYKSAALLSRDRPQRTVRSRRATTPTAARSAQAAPEALVAAALPDAPDSSSASLPEPERGPDESTTWPRESIEIDDCRFGFECTQTWSGLTEVPGQAKVRFCTACEAPVYYCEDQAELAKHSALGRCIAINVSTSSEMIGDVI